MHFKTTIRSKYVNQWFIEYLQKFVHYHFRTDKTKRKIQTLKKATTQQQQQQKENQQKHVIVRSQFNMTKWII